MVFTLPTYLTLKYSLFLKLTIASSAPTLFIGGALYAAFARYKWLLTSSKGRLVNKLTFNGKEVEIFSSFKTERVNIKSLEIELVEQSRKESFYSIRNIDNDNVYILPLNEHAVADHKALNLLLNNNKLSGGKYDISNVVLGRKHIEDKDVSSEVDTLARINLLNVLTGNLTSSELKYHLNSIPDNVVSDYLEQVRSKLAAEDNDSYAELSRFLNTLGANSELASHIKTNYHIHSVEGLKNLTKDQLTKAFNSVDTTGNFDDFYAKFNSFFSTYNK